MDVIGTGTGLVECLRIRRMIERHGEAFLNRVFTPREVTACAAARHSSEMYAARWAAKQAVLAALGAGRPRALLWADVEVRPAAGGGARVVLRGAVKDLARRRRLGQMWVSLAATRAYATAHAVALRAADGAG